MEFSEALLEEIYKKVKVGGANPMDACRALGDVWNIHRRDRGELFEAFYEYAMSQRGVK